VNAFARCVGICANRPALYAQPIASDGQEVQIQVLWINPPSDKAINPITVETTLRGGTVANVTKGFLFEAGSTFGPGQSKRVGVTRDSKQTTVAGEINGGGILDVVQRSAPYARPAAAKV
jgi:hypothetical protein